MEITPQKKDDWQRTNNVGSNLPQSSVQKQQTANIKQWLVLRVAVL